MAFNPASKKNILQKEKEEKEKNKKGVFLSLYQTIY